MLYVMGNSNNTKLRQRSESMQIKYKPDETFGSKSKSMMELGAKPVKSKTSVSVKEKPKLSQRDSTKSINGISRQKSIRRDVSHPISLQGRDIISQCFDNPHSEFGNKVLQRIFEKRCDYQNYVYALGKERSYQMSVRLKELVEEVVCRIHDPEHIMAITRQYGEEHVELKQFGFKPDFWVSIADAITVEGVILDMANHQPADTVAAWSSLVTMMFSSVRDGYYTALRKHRMSSRKCLRRQTTVESANDIVDSIPCSTTEPSLMSLSAGGLSSRRTSSISSESPNGTMRRSMAPVNIMAPVPSPTNASIYNGSQALVTYRQRPIFE